MLGQSQHHFWSNHRRLVGQILGDLVNFQVIVIVVVVIDVAVVMNCGRSWNGVASMG